MLELLHFETQLLELVDHLYEIKHNTTFHGTSQLNDTMQSNTNLLIAGSERRLGYSMCEHTEHIKTINHSWMETGEPVDTPIAK